MKEDDTMNSAGSIEERNMRRKHSEIGDTPISDDPDYITRQIGGKPTAKISNEYDG